MRFRLRRGRDQIAAELPILDPKGRSQDDPPLRFEHRYKRSRFQEFYLYKHRHDEEARIMAQLDSLP
jgi:hypothetical protein